MKTFCLLVFALYFTNVDSAPEPYCLETFNYSNCGRPRTAVFHYHKLGSRCEVVYWFGCPTANMFANEYQCTHQCIFRLPYEPPAQDKKWGEELNELKPNELKEVDDLLNDIAPQEQLANVANTEEEGVAPETEEPPEEVEEPHEEVEEPVTVGNTELTSKASEEVEFAI